MTDAELFNSHWWKDRVREEAATQLDSLLKERDALQARVKELEDGRNFWKSERDRIKAFLSDGDWQTVKSEQAWRNRALRAEQERAEAYERAAKECDAHATRLRIEAHKLPAWTREQSNLIASAVEVRMVEKAIRRLAGPEKA